MLLRVADGNRRQTSERICKPKASDLDFLAEFSARTETHMIRRWESEVPVGFRLEGLKASAGP